METRKFALGDQVRVRLDSYNSENPADVYTLSRVLPVLANVWQYRVKRVGDGQSVPSTRIHSRRPRPV